MHFHLIAIPFNWVETLNWNFVWSSNAIMCNLHLMKGWICQEKWYSFICRITVSTHFRLYAKVIYIYFSFIQCFIQTAVENWFIYFKKIVWPILQHSDKIMLCLSGYCASVVNKNAREDWRGQNNKLQIDIKGICVVSNLSTEMCLNLMFWRSVNILGCNLRCEQFSYYSIIILSLNLIPY